MPECVVFDFCQCVSYDNGGWSNVEAKILVVRFNGMSKIKVSKQRDLFDYQKRISDFDIDKYSFLVGKEIRSWLREFFFAGLTAILMVVFVVQPVKVEGTSMEPKLNPQDRIFVNKIVYRFSQISRGDIVVFWYPKNVSKSFIKRVIGLPGETVEIRSGVVFVDGRELVESYISSEYFDFKSFAPKVVSDGNYFVLGDHRNSSNDSRIWGLVPKQNIFGEAVFRYWPLSHLGLISEGK